MLLSLCTTALHLDRLHCRYLKSRRTVMREGEFGPFGAHRDSEPRNPWQGPKKTVVHQLLSRSSPGTPEDARRALQKLAFPLRDLVGMNIKLLNQLGQCLLAPDRRQSHLDLECRRMVPAWRSAHRFSSSQPS